MATRVLGSVGFVVAVALTACPPPPPNGCSSFSGRTPSPTPELAVGIINQKLSVRVDQPVTKCQLDTSLVKASAELIAPDDTHEAVETTLVAPYVATEGTSTVEVSFTPNQSGTWQLIVTFEPSLGRVQLAIPVAVDRSSGHLTFEVPYDSNDCFVQPWRTSGGAVLCERNARVLVLRPEADGGLGPRSADGGGGEEDFDGSQVVVDGPVIWSSAGQVLTRRIDTGTKLVVTGQVELPSYPSNVGGYFTQTMAIRPLALYSPGRSAVRVEFSDGGLVVTDLDLWSSGRAFEDDTGVWGIDVNAFSDGTLCSRDAGPGLCRELGGSLIANDRGGLWVQRTPGSFFTDLGFSRRPLSPTTDSSVNLTFGNHWSVPQPSIEYPLVSRERPVVSHSLTGRSVVVDFTDGQLGLRWYGPGKVLGTRNGTVVLQPKPGALSVTEY